MKQSKIEISGFDITTSKDSKFDHGQRANSIFFNSGKKNIKQALSAPPIIHQKREQYGAMPVPLSQPIRVSKQTSVQGQTYRRELFKLVNDRIFLMERSNRILYEQAPFFNGLQNQKLPLSILFSSKIV